MGNSEIIAIETRLQLWAAWEIKFKKNQQGWPKESAIARFQREGFMKNENKSRSSSTPYHFPKAEEINSLYNILKKEDRELALIIYRYYVDHIKMKMWAKKMRIHPSTLYRRLEMAKNWFATRVLVWQNN